jgi:hypothetical protein
VYAFSERFFSPAELRGEPRVVLGSARDKHNVARVRPEPPADGLR